jgi:hypothetical protein
VLRHIRQEQAEWRFTITRHGVVCQDRMTSRNTTCISLTSFFGCGLWIWGRSWFVVSVRTSSHKVGAGSESVNGIDKKNKIIFCDSRYWLKTWEF